jgi:hypothetical protein
MFAALRYSQMSHNATSIVIFEAQDDGFDRSARRRRLKRRQFILGSVGWATAGATAARAFASAPSLAPDMAAATASEVAAAALAASGPDLPYPLPLAGHWNTGAVRGGFDPQYQLRLLRQGRRILPWFQLYRPDQDAPISDIAPALREWARLRLPVSFIGTQWEVLVAEELAGTAAWNRRPDPSTTPRPPPLSPASPVASWYDAGRRWGAAPLLRRLQSIHPQPPRILFLSNNEQPKLGWTDVRDGRLELPDLAAGAGDEAIREAVAAAWVVRYRELLRGFREALPETWRRQALFVGYDAFGQPALGRWDGWPEYSLHTTDRFEPWSDVWDGASLSFYTSDWNPSTDHRVWSPQLEAMNLVPMLRQARHRHPDFWFEVSTWDGRSDELQTDKEDHYRSLGQRWDATRYAGMVQFGMWLLRPRVVREFRDTLSGRARYGADFEAILDAVDRVHEHPDLRRFWRSGRLVQNPAGQHPYRSAIPPSWQDAPRWFLLETDVAPPQPWSLETELSVYALALELGERPRREWLVYGSSPRHDALKCRVHLPGGGRPMIDAGRGGCFNLVRERPSGVERLVC